MMNASVLDQAHMGLSQANTIYQLADYLSKRSDNEDYAAVIQEYKTGVNWAFYELHKKV